MFVCVIGSLLSVIFVRVLVWKDTNHPPSLMLSHFSDIRERVHNLSTDTRRGKFQIYCMSEWPTFDAGWPREGTFHLPIILQVKAVIFRDKPDCHSDQVPYILIWQDMIKNPPPWLKLYSPPNEIGGQPMLYWPFSTSDLYNWKTQIAKFSDSLRDLIWLLDTVLFTHSLLGMTANSSCRFSSPLKRENEFRWKPEVCPGRGQTAH